MADVLVSHPDVGSVWLKDATIVGDQVTGEAWADRILDQDIYEQMTFPESCIRRWEYVTDDPAAEQANPRIRRRCPMCSQLVDMMDRSERSWSDALTRHLAATPECNAAWDRLLGDAMGPS
jgi:hypothetical protein